MSERELRSRAEDHLFLRIGSGLAEGGDEDDDESIADSIAALDETRAVEIAGDMLRMYELAAGLRNDACERQARRRAIVRGSAAEAAQQRTDRLSDGTSAS